MTESDSDKASEVADVAKEQVGAAVRPSPIERRQTPPGEDHGRGEMSAATVGRLLGLATVSELRLLEGKLDLMATKLSNVITRLDRAVALLNAGATGADVERIEVQIVALKSLIRESLTALAGKETRLESDGGKKPAAKIVSSEKP